MSKRIRQIPELKPHCDVGLQLFAVWLSVDFIWVIRIHSAIWLMEQVMKHYREELIMYISTFFSFIVCCGVLTSIYNGILYNQKITYLHAGTTINI